MASALVVDDSLVDQRLAGGLLEKHLGMKTAFAGSGREALQSIQRQMPDVVIADMRMPEMDGLELVEAIRAEHPTLPVIVMTAVGSEELAAAALRKGANGYVPKRHLGEDLAKVVKRYVAGSDEECPVLECLEGIRSQFLMDNDCSRIVPIVRYLKGELMRTGLFGQTTVMHIGVALEEAVTNAVHFGNLELNSELRDKDEQAFEALLKERSGQPPYCDRRVRVVADLSRERAHYVVRDDGPGFNTSRLPDPTDPTQLGHSRRRGLVLIHAFMDEVHHNDAGNEITMIKRRGAERTDTSRCAF
jgi:CheY-like chemotaxis protein/anti-sigma regulatory factor (Ser/Thr protein kinase)